MPFTGPDDLLNAVQAAAFHAQDGVAVIENGQFMTYGRLHSRAAAIAGGLRSYGITAGDRVGMLTEPGADAVAAFVAVRALRAAYVPLDPELPCHRIRLMLDNCAARVCLTDDDSHDIPGRPVVSVSAAAQTGLAAGRFTGDEGLRPRDAAYVIHTSGSTGSPKGVEIEHRGVVNLIADIDRRAPVPDGYRGSWWTRPNFDVSVWESWAPLIRRGTVVAVPRECRLEGQRLAGFIDSAGIQSAYFPAAFLPDLLDLIRENEGACRSLSRLLVGVEPIARGLLQDILRLRPDLTVVNGYGPTETTICSTLYVVPATGGGRADRTPIGTAVAGNRLHVVDDHGEPSADGTGELVVAGIGVARGYVGAPEEQPSPFIADPGGGDEAAYRTGDLVRTLPDGNLVFEGRLDRQLKVRGYRLEPSEIEAALRETMALRDAIVAVREGAGGEQILAAYVIPDKGVVVNPRQVLAHLRATLPWYAVPSVVLAVPRMPLTANGKVDHRALAAVPAPMPERPEYGEEDGPVRSVVGVWRRVLGISAVRPADSFPGLGGTSLGAAQAASLLRASTGKEVTAADVLDARSATALVRLLTAAQPVADAADDAAAWTRGLRSGPLGPAQLGLWVHEHLDGTAPVYNESVSFHLRGEVDVAALSAALLHAAAAHPAFGAVIRTQRGRPILDLVGCAPCVDLREIGAQDSGAGLDRLLAQEAARRFDLQSGPLMRCLILRRSPVDAVLLVTWHHLVVDGWSLRLFLGELADCYRLPHAQRSRLARTICDVNDRLNRIAASDEGRSSIRSAADRLRGIPPVFTFPATVRAAHDSASTLPVRIPADLVRKVEAASARCGITVSTVACAAYQRALATVLGVDRFLLGCAVSGRTLPGTESIAGYLVNTVMIRCERPNDLSETEYARTAGRELAAATKGQDAPFPLVVKQLLSGSRARLTSFPQLYFSIDEEARVEIGGVLSTAEPVAAARSKFDVMLSLRQAPGRINGELEHRTGSLSEEAAGRLVWLFRQGLGDFAAAVSGDPAGRHCADAAGSPGGGVLSS